MTAGAIRRRVAPSWPYEPDDEVCISTHRIRLSDGRLLASVVNELRRSDPTFPKPVRIATGYDKKREIRHYQWLEIELWLESRGLKALGPEPKTKPIFNSGPQCQEPSTDSVKAQLEQVLKDQAAKIEALEQRAGELSKEKSLIERQLKSSMRKLPGLMSGLEILRRGLPISQIAQPGVYFLLDGYEIVYVGQSINPYGRIKQHATEATKRFRSVFILSCDQRDLCKLEAAYIGQFRPRYNAMLLGAFTGVEEGADAAALVGPKPDTQEGPAQ